MKTTSVHRHIRSACFALLLAVAEISCNGLRLARIPTVHEDDWPMFARTTGRIAATHRGIVPPLTLEWSCDVAAGIGNGSPIIIDSTVFVGNLRGELYALQAWTGKQIGRVSLGDAIQGSPIIDGRTALVASSSAKDSFVAFDLLENKILWRQSFGDIEVTPLLFAQRIYLGNTAGVFFCLDRGTGNQIWRFDLPENLKFKGIRSSAAAEGTTVVFGAEDGTLYALNTETGAQRWKYRTGAPVQATPAIIDGMVCAGDILGRFHAIDIKDGSLRWTFDTGAPIYANALLTHGLAVVGTTGGMIFALTLREGMLSWKTAIGSPINSGAVATGDIIYVGTLKKEFMALKVNDGTLVWKEMVDGRIKSSPAVANGRILVATDEHTILSFRGSER